VICVDMFGAISDTKSYHPLLIKLDTLEKVTAVRRASTGPSQIQLVVISTVGFMEEQTNSSNDCAQNIRGAHHHCRVVHELNRRCIMESIGYNQAIPVLLLALLHHPSIIRTTSPCFFLHASTSRK